MTQERGLQGDALAYYLVDCLFEGEVALVVGVEVLLGEDGGETVVSDI